MADTSYAHIKKLSHRLLAKTYTDDALIALTNKWGQMGGAAGEESLWVEAVVEEVELRLLCR